MRERRLGEWAILSILVASVATSFFLIGWSYSTKVHAWTAAPVPISIQFYNITDVEQAQDGRYVLTLDTGAKLTSLQPVPVGSALQVTTFRDAVDDPIFHRAATWDEFRSAAGAFSTLNRSEDIQFWGQLFFVIVGVCAGIPSLIVAKRLVARRRSTKVKGEMSKVVQR